MKTKQQRKAEKWKEFEKIRDPAFEKYEKIRKPAFEEFEKIRDPALKEYQKKCEEIDDEN